MFDSKDDISYIPKSLVKARNAGVAQLAEQLICNQQVKGSSPFTSSFEGEPSKEFDSHSL